MILYILIFCCFITIYSFHIPNNGNNCYLTNNYIKNRNIGYREIVNQELNLINDDKEFEGVVGYEASEKVKERLPKSLQNISQRLVKSILEHDLNLINEKSDFKPRWKIRKDSNRLDACYFKVGEYVLGRVSAVFPTYALVDIGSTKYGVLHARDMSKGWVDRVDLTLSPKEDIRVHIKDINQQYNTIKLSLIPPNEYYSPDGSNNGLSDNYYNTNTNTTSSSSSNNTTNTTDNGPKEVFDRGNKKNIREYDVEDVVEGIIVRKSPLGYYIDIGASVHGFLHINDIKLTDKRRKSYTGESRYRDPNKYRIGNKLTELYIKSIDLIKNRIGLTENTLLEELERNVMTGRETPEQQSSFLRNYNLDYMKELRVRDIQINKMIGSYDDYLKDLNAKRNASVPYLLYLENLQKQRELEDEQKELFKDMSTKGKINRDTDKFNKLSHKISALIDSAYKPTEDEQSIYKFGDTKTWKPTIYTPFKPTPTVSEDADEKEAARLKQIADDEEKARVKLVELEEEARDKLEEETELKEGNENTKEEKESKEDEQLKKELEKQKEINKNYFKILSDEITDGLRDVQGENYNLSEKYEYTNKYDEPYKMINYLFEQFHQKPSNTSEQKDKYENQRQYVHSSKDPGAEFERFNLNKQDLTEWDQMYWKEQLEIKEKQRKKKQEIIDSLLKSKDKDEVELGEMMMETIDYDPFEHCKTFKETEESEFRGASRLFKDDVSQWNNRVYNMILKNKLEIPEQILNSESQEDIDQLDEIELPKIKDPLEDDEEIENIDPDILSALDENEQDEFTEPQIEQKKDYLDKYYKSKSKNKRSQNDLDFNDEEDGYLYSHDLVDEDEFNPENKEGRERNTNGDNLESKDKDENKKEEEDIFRVDPELLKPIDQQIESELLNERIEEERKYEEEMKEIIDSDNIMEYNDNRINTGSSIRFRRVEENRDDMESLGDNNNIDKIEFKESKEEKYMDNGDTVNDFNYMNNEYIEQEMKRIKTKEEKINIKKLISKLQKNKKLQKNFSKKDSPLTTLLLREERDDKDNLNRGKSNENKKEAKEEKDSIEKDNNEINRLQYTEPDEPIDPSVNSMLNDLKRVVQKMTISRASSEEDLDNNNNNNIQNNKSNDIESSGDNNNNDNEYKEEMEEDSRDKVKKQEKSENEEYLDRLNKYIMEKLEERDQLEVEIDEDDNPFSNKDDFKMLTKFAKQQLTPKDLELAERITRSDDYNEYQEERMMNILKSVYKREEKKTKYKYYKEGYDHYLLRQHNLQKQVGKGEAGKREMQVKLNILLRNKNFINMLKRLDVDPNELTYENITKLLPQQFQYQRLTPTTGKVP